MFKILLIDSFDELKTFTSIYERNILTKQKTQFKCVASQKIILHVLVCAFVDNFYSIASVKESLVPIALHPQHWLNDINTYPLSSLWVGPICYHGPFSYVSVFHRKSTCRWYRRVCKLINAFNITITQIAK